jgi:hypothetical protein
LSNDIVTIADLLATMRAGQTEAPAQNWLAQSHLQVQRARQMRQKLQARQMRHQHRMGTDGLSVE